MAFLGSTPLAVGGLAPDFELQDQTGRLVRLSSFRGQKSVILFFYPKDFTPICTAESCHFRDRYPAIQRADTEVFGISDDDHASHQRFIAEHQLPFPLLADPGGVVRRQYGVKSSLGVVPGRVTYVVDRQGKIIHVVDAPLSAKKHADDALAALGQNP